MEKRITPRRRRCARIVFIVSAAILIFSRDTRALAQDTAGVHAPPPVSHPTLVTIGVGSTIFPTPILATQSLGGGGGGIIGSNITVNAAAKEDVAPHWRIPLSFSLAFLRGNEIFYHDDIASPGDTLADLYSLANSVNMASTQIGIEYYYASDYITPFIGADFMYNWIGETSLNFTIQRASGQTVESETNTLPAVSRFGAVLRAGADLPLPDLDGLYFSTTVEIGAANLIGRANDWQLFTATPQSQSVSAARVASGQTGEAVATFFRLLLSIGWKF